MVPTFFYPFLFSLNSPFKLVYLAQSHRVRGVGGGAPPCRGGALSLAPPWRRWGWSGPRTEWRPARGERGHRVHQAARRPRTRERGHRVHRGVVGLFRPSHRMAAGAAGEGRPARGGRRGAARGHRVHQGEGVRPGGRRGGTEVTEYTGVVLGWSGPRTEWRPAARAGQAAGE